MPCGILLIGILLLNGIEAPQKSLLIYFSSARQTHLISHRLGIKIRSKIVLVNSENRANDFQLSFLSLHCPNKCTIMDNVVPTTLKEAGLVTAGSCVMLASGYALLTPAVFSDFP